MLRKLLLSIALLCLTSAAAIAQPATVTLERVAPARWRATYQLPAPAASLRFARPASFFRERVWSVATPGYHLVRRGNWQVVQLDSGAAARRTIAFEFPEYTDALPKEYELFLAFTDGGRAIYTGHFHAVALFADGDSASIRNIQLTTPPETHAIVMGRIERGNVALADTADDGTYIYVGSARPIETPDVVAIVDPGMPPWLKAMFDARVPQLFASYARRFGASLSSKPVVLFSYEDNDASGLSSGGGSLDGFLNMSFTGAAWKTPSAAASEQAFALIAHESAHLWNGQLARNRAGGAGAWMHEGSADAMANEMLIAFGVIDSARYRARREEALNRCATSLTGASMEGALNRGETRVVYDCGFVMAMWTAAAAAKAQPGADLLAFWRQLVAAARARDGRYDEALYFDVVRTFGVPDSVVSRMRVFLTNSDSVRVAVAGLQSAGVGVHEGRGAPPAAYQSNLVRLAMIHLMRQACTRVSFSNGSPMRTDALPACAPFATALQVFQIQGLRVRDQGAALYDAVAAVCAAGAGVALQAADGATLSTVPCTRPLGPRSPWFAFGS